MTYQLHHGDCLNILPMMERESIDAIVTDPPYGLGFMGKDWDHGVPGEHFWREAYRVAKPGAHLLAFGGTRTFHRLAVAIEDAGWEIRDTVMWVYGQGFPKSHDVSKAIDREAGAEREVIGFKRGVGGENLNQLSRPNGNDSESARGLGAYGQGARQVEIEVPITSPATPAAAQWQGYGTALKPAWEPIIVARKPLAGTVAENVQRYGTGAMNIDACRIGVDKRTPGRKKNSMIESQSVGWGTKKLSDDDWENANKGRWPANLIHDGSAEVLAGFPANAPSGGGFKGSQNRANLFSGFKGNSPNPSMGGDTGSAARFFKSCPPDDICLLCLTPKHDTVSAWKNILALNAEKHGWTAQAISEFTARINAIGSQSESLAQSVKSVASLCDSCETLIVVALVGIKTSAFSSAELQVILDCISSYRNSILTQSLVFFAENQGSTDITQTMISLLKSSGCVNPATTNYIPATKKQEQSRFVYSAKASKQDRDEGCEDLPVDKSCYASMGINDDDGIRARGRNPENQNRTSHNHHPTVKPTALMRYLCRLVTPPQGVVLDPFMGSGSTGKAAILEGFNFIGIDTEIEYIEIAARRIEHACEKVGIVVEQPMLIESRREIADRPKQMLLL